MTQTWTNVASASLTRFTCWRIYSSRSSCLIRICRVRNMDHSRTRTLLSGFMAFRIFLRINTLSLSGQSWLYGSSIPKYFNDDNTHMMCLSCWYACQTQEHDENATYIHSIYRSLLLVIHWWSLWAQAVHVVSRSLLHILSSKTEILEWDQGHKFQSVIRTSRPWSIVPGRSWMTNFRCGNAFARSMLTLPIPPPTSVIVEDAGRLAQGYAI